MKTRNLKNRTLISKNRKKQEKQTPYSGRIGSCRPWKESDHGHRSCRKGNYEEPRRKDIWFP